MVAVAVVEDEVLWDVCGRVAAEMCCGMVAVSMKVDNAVVVMTLGQVLLDVLAFIMGGMKFT